MLVLILALARFLSFLLVRLYLPLYHYQILKVVSLLPCYSISLTSLSYSPPKLSLKAFLKSYLIIFNFIIIITHLNLIKEIFKLFYNFMGFWGFGVWGFGVLG